MALALINIEQPNVPVGFETSENVYSGKGTFSMTGCCRRKHKHGQQQELSGIPWYIYLKHAVCVTRCLEDQLILVGNVMGIYIQDVLLHTTCCNLTDKYLLHVLSVPDITRNIPIYYYIYQDHGLLHGKHSLQIIYLKHA